MLRNEERLIVLMALAFCMVTTTAFAETEVAVGGVRMESEANAPGVPGDVEDSLEDPAPPEESDKERNFEMVIAPLPSRKPQFGWMVSLPVIAMYRPSFSDPQDGVWMSGAFGFYSENKSWGAGVFQRTSFGGDRWRVKGSLFHADLNYDYYGIGGGGDGPSIELNQPTDLVMLEALRRVAPDLYVGLKGAYSQIEIGPKLPGDILPPGLGPEDLSIDLTLSALTPRLEYDTRDHEFYPRDGFLIDADVTISRKTFGADLEYERYIFSLNHYYPLGESGVLASRINVQYAANNAPFFLYPAFGQKADLRGYQTGTYRDRFLFAAQTEYRYRFTKRIGAVAFAGVGTVAPDLAEWGETLPSIGAGFRWVIAPRNNISLRIDVARGKNDTVYYVGVGEAF